MRHGSLFSGYGGLDLAVNHVFGSTTAWVSDIDSGACKVLAHRFTEVPNLGDITAIDWDAVEPVDIMSGGSPCPDLSTAGRRAGMTEGTRSNLWVAMREGIARVRPRYVVWENVRGAYSATAASAMESDPGLLGDHPPGQPVLRALGRVVGDLASLGYMSRWVGLRASDVGAPHQRHRVFLLAHATSDPRGLSNRDGGDATADATSDGHRDTWASGVGGVAAATIRGDLASLAHTDQLGSHGRGTVGLEEGWRESTDRGATAADSDHQGLEGRPPELECPDQCPTGAGGLAVQWGDFEPAIRRWERVTGHPAPSPVDERGRLTARFPEWMMGLASGWITDVPDITRTEALRLAGNGVVPQQAVAALAYMLDIPYLKGHSA